MDRLLYILVKDVEDDRQSVMRMSINVGRMGQEERGKEINAYDTTEPFVSDMIKEVRYEESGKMSFYVFSFTLSEI